MMCAVWMDQWMDQWMVPMELNGLRWYYECYVMLLCSLLQIHSINQFFEIEMDDPAA